MASRYEGHFFLSSLNMTADRVYEQSGMGDILDEKEVSFLSVATKFFFVAGIKVQPSKGSRNKMKETAK